MAKQQGLLDLDAPVLRISGDEVVTNDGTVMWFSTSNGRKLLDALSGSLHIRDDTLCYKTKTGFASYARLDAEMVEHMC
jgi:hypothetical protein